MPTNGIEFITVPDSVKLEPFFEHGYLRRGC